MEVVVWFALLGLGAYLLFFKNRAHQPEPKQLGIRSDELPAAIEPTADELEIARAGKVIQVGSEAREQAYREHKASLREAEIKLSQADKFVRDSGLDTAVPWLFDEMHHWPSWLSGTHDWKLPVDISEVEGAGSYGDSWVAWKWREHMFKIHFKKHKNYGFDDESEHADFSVESGGQSVLKINCSRNWTKEFDDWHYFGVDVLKVGSWIGYLVEFYQEARLAHEQAGYDRDAEYTLGRARGIEISEPDVDEQNS